MRGDIVLSRAELVLSSGTVGNPALPELLTAARAGDYTGLAIWWQDLDAWHAAGHSAADIRVRCADAGLPIVQLDGLLAWAAGPAAARAVTERDRLLTAAGALGIPCVSAICSPAPDTTFDWYAECLAAAVGPAAAAGVEIAVEFSPWKDPAAPVPFDLATTRRLVETVQSAGPGAASAPGLVLDSWHLARGGVPLDELAALPPELVRAVQLSDTDPRPHDDLVAETMRHRRLPGEGDADLTGFVRALDDIDATGGTVPVTVEVLAEELLPLGPVEVARRTAAATRGVLEPRG